MAETVRWLCGDGHVDVEGGLFVERFPVLEAVVELAEHAIEEVPLGGCMPVPVPVSAPSVVGLGAG